MFLFYSTKRIHKWANWHKSGAKVFCAVVGAWFTAVLLVAFAILFVVADHSLPFGRMVGASLAMILGGVILGWVAWGENEEKYAEWLEKQQLPPTPPEAV